MLQSFLLYWCSVLQFQILSVVRECGTKAGGGRVRAEGGAIRPASWSSSSDFLGSRPPLEATAALTQPALLPSAVEAEPEQSWSQQGTVRSGAGRSASLRPGPTSWPRCPGTSTPAPGWGRSRSAR